MKKIKLNKTIIKTMIFAILLFLILVLSIIFRADKKNYAKYSNYFDVESVSEISKPIFQVEGNNNIRIDGKNDTEYYFTVKNYDSDHVSDVPLEYYIKFVNNSKANLQFILTKNGKNVELNDNSTSKLTLKNVEKQTDNYRLKIKYSDNSNQTEDIIGNVQIKVEAVQAEA